MNVNEKTSSMRSDIANSNLSRIEGWLLLLFRAKEYLKMRKLEKHYRRSLKLSENSKTK